MMLTREETKANTQKKAQLKKLTETVKAVKAESSYPGTPCRTYPSERPELLELLKKRNEQLSPTPERSHHCQ